jgi:signal transduction histidine kinase
MRRLRLSTLLITVNVGLVLLAVTGMAFVAVRLLRQLADDQALARVGQAGVSAQSALHRSGQEVFTSAQLLSRHPTLISLLQSNPTESLTDFLNQFQTDHQLSACVVIRGGRIVASSGPPLAWEAITAEPPPAQNYFFPSQSANVPFLLAAQVDIPSLPEGKVLVVVLLDQKFSQQLGEEIGVPVTILGRTEVATVAASARLRGLRMQALTSGESLTARLDEPDQYIALAPLHAPTGEAVGLIETDLSGADIARSVSELVQNLLLLTLVMGALAALISFLMGRRLGRPLRALTGAAARIGHGDLATPIPLAPRQAFLWGGAEIGMLALTLDGMRRRLLQLTANLSRQQAESNAIVTRIVEGVFTVDRERRIQYINPQAAALLGVSTESVIGRFCGDVLDPQGPGGVRPCEEQCPIIHARFRAGARATEHLRLHSGERRTVVITSAPPSDDPLLSGDSSAGLRQVQVMRDETEEEATRRLRDAVLAHISHEFKTPLSAQLASIELLLDQLPDLTRDQIGELVVSLQRGTLRLMQLIDNLLESVRIEAGEQTLRRRPVMMDEVIERALELTRPLFDQRQQAVLVELPYPMPPVSGDAPRLTQVFVNLLANANKFSPTGSTVNIGGAVTSEAITVWVEDQGPGLPETMGPSLFVPFIRSFSEEPEQGGAGLGLWIVKSIIERHGGQVEATSRAQGTGTRIVVTLPREKVGETIG